MREIASAARKAHQGNANYPALPIITDAFIIGANYVRESRRGGLPWLEAAEAGVGMLAGRRPGEPVGV